KDLRAARAAQAKARAKTTDDAANDEARSRITFLTPRQIAETSSADPDWIIRGLLAKEAITELDGKIKASGKTTLTLDAVRAIIDGEPFLSYQTTPTRVVYLSEQQRGPFLMALKRANLEDTEDLIVLFRSDFNGLPW